MPPGTAFSGFLSFLDTLVLPEQDALFDIGIDLPAICWMGFSQVHQEEFHVFSVLVVDCVHALDLSAERGSTVAT